MDGLLVEPGTVLAGRYALERELGRGGMATVYLARDVKHHRSVAVKVLRPELAASLGAERFLREIEIAARLTHPHILPLHDSGNADGVLFYVMPFVEGESLRERLKREGPLPLADALEIAHEIADALSFSHTRGVVHRDIKPGNILLEAGHAVVADFGIARAISEAGSDRVTAGTLPLGTPAYMSPEQASAGDVVDGRTDLYALGCVLYEMLSGAPPFTARTAQGMIARHRTERAPSIRVIRPDLPPEVEEMLARVLAKLPADQFPTARAFVEELEKLSSGMGHRPRRPRRLPASTAAAAGLALALAGLALVGSLSRRPSVPASATVTAVVLPFDGAPARLNPDSATSVHLLFAEALDWMPGLHGMDGSSLVGPSGGWRSQPMGDLSKAARGLGTKYLVAGAVLRRPSGSEVSVDLYEAGTGERVMHGSDTAHGASLEGVVGRLALLTVGALARREGVDLGSGRAVLASTTSLPAAGRLMQGQAKVWLSGYASAAADFRAAVAADSTCGLAYHRLSVAELWLHDFAASLAAVEAGLRHRDLMDQRWVRLLEAQRYLVMGYGDSAAAAFQHVVLDDRTDIDGWLGLGESLVHFAAFTGDSPMDARPAFDRVVLLDSTFAPIYEHLIDLALHAGDESGARRYLARLPPGHPLRVGKAAAVALRFGSRQDRVTALAELRSADRQALSEAVITWMHGAFDLGLADTAAGFLVGPDRTPADRRRGGQYRLVALAGQRRWAEGLRAWSSVAGGQPFDPWLVQAFLAGYPARDLAEPMFLWARAQVVAGRAPDFGRPPWDEVRQGFEALVHRATLEGDSAETLELLEAIDRAPNSDPSEPSPGALRASLNARRALLAGDTSQAIGLLQQSVSRILEIFTANHPLMAMGPQRFLLTELLTARGDTAGARRWRDSFSNSWSVADVFYLAKLGPRGPAP